jgi:glycosyltransferase involved in cell wall biosynthesis
MPRVSVLLPVFNAEDVVHDAVTSVLDQTFRDLELVVIDDGSTDDTLQRVMEHDDARIRVVRHDQNQGIVAALNSGLSAANGELIARIDADDIAQANKIELQVAFLDHRADIGLVASGWTTIRLTDGGLISRLSPNPHHGGLRLHLLFGNPFPHVTVAIRRMLLDQVGGYRVEQWPVEDYDLWLRLSEATILSALPQSLTVVRARDEGISARNSSIQRTKAARLSYDSLERLLGTPPPDALLSRTRETCADIREHQAVLVEAARKVETECLARGIDPLGIEDAAARILVGWGYRLGGSKRCRRAALSMLVKSPGIATRAVRSWLAGP